jgi:tRNA(fMet)-specific endonuclease VapC
LVRSGLDLSSGYFNLKRIGKGLGALDMMIGAHSFSLGAVLLTNDKAFRSVPNLELDWTQN